MLQVFIIANAPGHDYFTTGSRTQRCQQYSKDVNVNRVTMQQLVEFTSNHPLLSGGFVVAFGLLAWTELMRQVRGLKELSLVQAVAWINDPKAVIVDISAAADYNKGHIINAKNIALSRIMDPDAEVQKLKDSKVLVVCKTGQTAVQAAANLKKMGVVDVAVLKGGMAQWINEQYPVTRK